jgi:hypothetical protein
MPWMPGMKQVVVTCEECGGPGITSPEDFEASAGKRFHHVDPNVCANVRRNMKSQSDKLVKDRERAGAKTLG